MWHCPDVKDMRKRLRFGAYACLVVYTLVVAWINLCYIASYDAPTIRSGTAAANRAAACSWGSLHRQTHPLFRQDLHSQGTLSAGSTVFFFLLFFRSIIVRGAQIDHQSFGRHAYIRGFFRRVHTHSYMHSHLISLPTTLHRTLPTTYLLYSTFVYIQNPSTRAKKGAGCCQRCSPSWPTSCCGSPCRCSRSQRYTRSETSSAFPRRCT